MFPYKLKQQMKAFNFYEKKYWKIKQTNQTSNFKDLNNPAVYYRAYIIVL